MTQNLFAWTDIDRFSDGAPPFLEMPITCPQHDAPAEAVVSLIAGECLVSRVVNENKQVAGFGFQFFVEGRFHGCVDFNADFWFRNWVRCFIRPGKSSRVLSVGLLF